MFVKPQNDDDEILVSSLYLFYDFNKHKLVATTIVNYPGLPFAISPTPRTASDRYAFQMYSTNNLYYIISNGGSELTQEQGQVLFNARDKVIGPDSTSRIENEQTATLTRKEILNLITEIDKFISKHQLEIIAEMQNIDIYSF